MNTDAAHAFVDHLAKLLELAGVAIIIGGLVSLSRPCRRLRGKSNPPPVVAAVIRKSL